MTIPAAVVEVAGQEAPRQGHVVMRILISLAIVLAGCSLAIQPECDPNTGPERAVLACDTAVAAALDALPGGHPEITRLQFLYGSPIPCCSTLPGQGEEPPVGGYVVVMYAGETPRQFVPPTM